MNNAIGGIDIAQRFNNRNTVYLNGVGNGNIYIDEFFIPGEIQSLLIRGEAYFKIVLIPHIIYNVETQHP